MPTFFRSPQRYVIFARDHHYTIQVMSGKITDEFTRWLVRTAISLRTGEQYPTIHYYVSKTRLRQYRAAIRVARRRASFVEPL